MRRLIPTALLLGLILAPRALAAATAERDSRLSAEIAFGHDSNPLELTDEVTLPGRPPAGAAFAQVALDARLAHQWSPRAGYFVAAAGRSRAHGAALDDADASQGRVEAGLGFVLFARGERRLSAALRGSFGMERSTFVDPATGEVYLIADPNSQLELPDRFDANVASANLDLRLRLSQRLLLMLDSGMQRTTYANDYDTLSTLDPLDDRSLFLRPGLRWQMAPKVRLDLSAEFGALRYDELSALEADATPAAESRRAYRSSGLRWSLKVDPTEALTLSLGMGLSDREDTYAGYYNLSGVTSFVAAAWSPWQRTRLALHLSQSHLDYERAVVDPLTNNDLRGGDRLRGVAGLERELNPHLVLFGEAGAIRSDNQDPLYTFDRNWALAGVRFRR